MSVRLRLTLLQTFLLGLVLTAFAVIVYAAIARQELSQLDFTLRLQAEALQRQAFGEIVSRRGPREAAPARPLLGGGSPAEREARLAVALDDRPDDTILAAVVRPNGAVIASGADDPLTVPAAFVAEVAAQGQGTIDVPRDGAPVHVLGLALDPLPRGEGVVLLVGASLAPIEATLAGWRMTLAMVVLGTILVSAAIAWFMAARALRPVDQMTVAAQAIGQTADFARRLPESPQQDELGRLARTFNAMLARLAEAYGTQRRFLADASHELRTPLSVINTNAAALLDGVGLEPAERTEALRAIVRESARMARLVADLLALARADAGQPLAREPVALDTLVLEVYQQQRALAGAVRLALGDWEQVAVIGDGDRLQQVVVNLVDNALRFTPAGGTVTLDVARSPAAAIVRVRDTGIGIDPAQQARIFERFYRVDQPRSRTLGGTGLGLAIAAEVAAAHGGELTVESTPGSGSVFTLTLPLAPATAALDGPAPTASPEPRPVTAAPGDR